MIKLKSILLESTTDTPEFKRWFGDSKVVDTKGNPLVVYHGTSGPEFTDFNIPSHFGSKDASNDIINKRQQFRVSLGNDRIIPVYLSIQNPKRIIDIGYGWKKELEQAKAEGYDGIVYKNKIEGVRTVGGKFNFSDSYIPISSSQIKSAISKDIKK